MVPKPVSSIFLYDRLRCRDAVTAREGWGRWQRVKGCSSRGAVPQPFGNLDALVANTGFDLEVRNHATRHVAV